MDDSIRYNPLARARAGGPRATPAGDNFSSGDEEDASARAHSCSTRQSLSLDSAMASPLSRFRLPHCAHTMRGCAMRTRRAARAASWSAQLEAPQQTRTAVPQQAREITRQQRVIAQFRAERCACSTTRLRAVACRAAVAMTRRSRAPSAGSAAKEHSEAQMRDVRRAMECEEARRYGDEMGTRERCAVSGSRMRLLGSPARAHGFS